MKHYLFTLIFGLLFISASAGKLKTSYFSGVWDGKIVQIINPRIVGKNKFCIKKIYINGVKIKVNYKAGGLEINPSDYGFSPDDELLIEVKSLSDCDAKFHSEGFILQKD